MKTFTVQKKLIAGGAIQLQLNFFKKMYLQKSAAYFKKIKTEAFFFSV